MMYANKTLHGGNFPHLMPAFSGMGVTEENIQIAEQYLNLENPRDDSLLDKIQQQDFSKYFRVYSADSQAVIKAVKKDINKVNSDELDARFILLIYAIGGTSCPELGLYEIGSNWEKRREICLRVLASRYGNDAPAIFLAINTARYSSNSIGSYGMETNNEKPEVCLKAISYLSDYYAKLKLVISAMNRINPEPKNILEIVASAVTGNKKNTLVQQVLKIMDEEIIPGSKVIPQKNPYLTALALASGYDEKYFILFKSEFAGTVQIFTEWVLKSQVNKPRILDVIERAETPTPKYIGIIAHTDTNEERYWQSGLKSRDSRLKDLAQNYPDAYKQQMNAETDIAIAKNMEKILKSVDSSYQGGNTLRDKARQNCIDAICKNNSAEREYIEQYLYGSMSSEDFIKTVLPNLRPTNAGYYGGESVKYVPAFGLDDFAERCICYRTIKDYDSFYFPLNSLPGYELKNHEEKVIGILRKHAVPMSFILNGVIKMSENEYNKSTRERAVKKFCEFVDEIATLDTNSLIIEARCARIEILGESGKYKYLDELFASAQDSSKKVRELLINYLPAPSDEVNEKILNLIQGKKIAQRELGIALLEKNFPDSYKDAVQKAFDSEKNEKLKNRLAVLLNADVPEVQKAITSTNIIDEYSKGNKAKKVAWLFQNPFTPVHDKDGNEVEEKYLIALVNCYASMDIAKFTRSKEADELAQNLNQTELERFAQEVFSRFVDKGAEAKQKWVIYFTGILGGMDAVTSLQHYIKDWSEHSRGAIASEAVNALAFNGSSVALMAVDNMARKFKNKQVRNAANHALTNAADALNITREELADRIVPDLGFDENLCRIFDYGQRQFKVYLTPALELEIFEGDKKLKNLPKPGKTDDTEKAEQASKEFKEMKKQMKATIQSQKSRLEYVLLCDRKWSADGWKDLFIRKPVMHCFAIGLIWGAYDEKENLLQTFRYMEDGSFTTSDEDEYELPENAKIGLVHPIELDDETRSAWNEQLSDYEISQPFLQINRPVYRILPEEKGKTSLQRFSGTELTNLSLINKMTKIGWEKGQAEDAGMFYEFERTDVEKQEKINDKIVRTGYYAEFRFSGAYIASGYMDAEDVTLEDVRFWNLADKIEDKNALSLDKINPRYFSEIISQLTGMFGETEEQDA
ncbi:MAG: DUF4132 domain-containing protein [Oscillospiraceae bacterium]|nr:DUF4132 domain-containing protein [Oscillospiraceae bacterium]